MQKPELIRDYASDLRPDSWGEVCGQATAVRCLKHYCTTGRPPKAIAFIGPFGTGKSTLARLTAMSLACSGRKDEDPDPCGRCDSCLGFTGSFHSFETMVIPPHVSENVFRGIIGSVRNYPGATMFSEIRRPVPVYIDDLDEHPKAHQQHLKRQLDGHWYGVVLAATTKPKHVEPGLLDRFQVFWLQPPEIPDLVGWIGSIGKRVGVGAISEDAAATLARCGDMNHRDILKLMQMINAAGMNFSVEGVEKAALMFGLRG
ncbi:MAG: AAA family ATPase [Pseudomonadota bacterium]